jgi:hypothetical protein
MDDWAQKCLRPVPISNSVTYGYRGLPRPPLYTDALLSVNKSLPEK